MKLSVLAASTLLGVVALAPASFAQGDGTATLEMSRTQQSGAMGTSSRMATPGPAPTLEGNRPAAGMFPQPTGPVRGFTGGASNAPAESGDIRNALRRE
jgi:hypothetical protein